MNARSESVVGLSGFTVTAVAIMGIVVAVMSSGCGVKTRMDNSSAPPQEGTTTMDTEKSTIEYADARHSMVVQQLRRRDIDDDRVLAAMAEVPRHEFVPSHLLNRAYSDSPLPIGMDQTISQPYIVALMSQLARPRSDSRALDVGTGSGYQAAILGKLCAEVYSIEILDKLARRASTRLRDLGYDNIEVRCGDGYQGWPEKAPFDLIVVAAAPSRIPPPLIDQLAPGGRLVIPVGTYSQKLTVVEKGADGEIERWTVAPVAFVPMTGKARD